MQDYGPGSHPSKYQALGYKMQWYRETRWSKGCRETLTLEAKIYSSCYSTADPSQYFIHHFLASWGHEGLSQLKSCPRDFWATLGTRQGVAMWQDLYLNIPISGARTNLVPYRQSSLIFFNPGKTSKKPRNEELTSPRGQFWKLTLPHNIRYGEEMQFVQFAHHFVVTCMGHELEASHLRKTRTSWGRGLGATSPTQDQL